MDVVCCGGSESTSGAGYGREDFVFKEGGEIFPWRNLGASAVQRVREAV